LELFDFIPCRFGSHKEKRKKEGSEKGEREAAWISLVGSFSPSVCVCVSGTSGWLLGEREHGEGTDRWARSD
jgi:hypothetical protein